MKTTGLLMLLVLILSACGEAAISSRAVATAVAKTLAAQPVPTHTSPPVGSETSLPSNTAVTTNSPQPAHTTTPTPTPTVHPSNTPSPNLPPTPTLVPPNPGVSIPTIAEATCAPTTYAPVEAFVTKVIDGDTIEVEVDGILYPLRYIGIDTPEINTGVEALGAEAAARNKQLVEGKTVILVKDVNDFDRYNRLLRYVFVGDLFVNHELVRQGFANETAYPPDTACQETLQAAEAWARENGIGIWAPPTATETPGDGGARAPAPNVTITQIYYNGSGQKEPDEYVEILNNGSQPVQLQGWTLRDEANHVFRFPSFMMQPGQSCRIYTNEMHPDSCGFNFNNTDSAVWNNSGDCAYLLNQDQEQIARYCY